MGRTADRVTEEPSSGITELGLLTHSGPLSLWPSATRPLLNSTLDRCVNRYSLFGHRTAAAAEVVMSEPTRRRMVRARHGSGRTHGTMRDGSCDEQDRRTGLWGWLAEECGLHNPPPRSRKR